MINLDRDLDQLQAAISHSKNSSRSETIQLFDKNHFYFLEHPPTKAELLNSMVGKGRTWPNQSQQYSGHSASNVIDSVQVGCPCSYDPERHRLGRRSPCEIRLPILDCEGRLCEHKYIYDLLLELMDQNRKQEHILSNHYFEYLSNFRHEELKITMIATHITFSNFIKKHKHQWKSMYFSWRIKHY